MYFNFKFFTRVQLGVAGALAVGLSVVHSTVKALLPAKVAAPMVGGAWFVGGALIAWRLTAGTVAGWVGLVERNSKRKRTLARKLQLIEVSAKKKRRFPTNVLYYYFIIPFPVLLLCRTVYSCFWPLRKC